TVTRPVREDDDLVVREVWNRVDGRRSKGPPAPDGEADVQRHHDEAILQGQFNESINHGPRHVMPCARTAISPGNQTWADTRRVSAARRAGRRAAGVSEREQAARASPTV